MVFIGFEDFSYFCKVEKHQKQKFPLALGMYSDTSKNSTFPVYQVLW